jgi:hypothetical protein
VINNDENNYSCGILCFRKALQLVPHVIFNLHTGSSVVSIVLVFKIFREWGKKKNKPEDQSGGRHF